MSALFSPGFLIPLGTIICVYALAAAGLQLNIGQTGLLNFGQVGFMAIGAYTMAITVVQLHWPLPLGVLAGIALACLAAVGLGFSTLRLRSDYFAIATVAFAEIVRSTAANWSDVTGGMQGLSGFETSLGSLSEQFLEKTNLKAAYYGIPLLVISVILLVIAAFRAMIAQSTRYLLEALPGVVLAILGPQFITVFLPWLASDRCPTSHHADGSKTHRSATAPGPRLPASTPSTACARSASPYCVTRSSPSSSPRGWARWPAAFWLWI